MGRGFISGVFWGLVVGGLGLAVISLVGSQRVPPSPPLSEQPAQVRTDVALPDIAPGDDTPVATSAGEAQSPAPAPAHPQASSPSTAQPAPSPDARPAAPGAAAQPVVQGTDISSASAPVADPAAPVAPAGSAPVAGSELAALTAQSESPVLPGGEALPAGKALPETPGVSAQGISAGVAPGEEPAAPPPASSDVLVVTDTPGMATGGTGDDPAPVAGAPLAPRAPIKSAPVAAIQDQAANVTTNRLPRIGVDSAQDTADAAAAAAAAAPAARAIIRNAAPFENPEGRPVMGVLLQDVGLARTALGTLQNLPFALSFVVDAAAEDAAQAVAFYRAAGAEVVLGVPLPQGAAPRDVEVTLQAYDALLQQAVAVAPPAEAGFQALGATARQVAAALVASGHGLVSFPQGLNTGHKSALKEGVPAGLIFRELDNDGQSPANMRRFMDNAAFRARQEPGVIMLGHARPETLQALIEWSLGNRAKSVMLAPVSVVLLGN